MIDVAMKLLKEITSQGYQAYIVGGFVRDHLLDIKSNDIDVTTNATPKQLKEIFTDNCIPNEDYGSVIVELKGVRFEITTFRKDVGYLDNRHPAEVKYIDSLDEDLLRRDFTINTICMGLNKEIIDLLNGREDLDKKIIRAVGDADYKFSEDSLRILRAVRFATILDFELADDVKTAIVKNRELIKNLSYQRKKEELDKIFTSSNVAKGISLLLELGLDKELELDNLYKLKELNTTSLIAIWSLLDVSDIYPFNKNELDLMNDIKIVMNLNNNDPYTLYRYGLYVNSVAGEIKGLDIKNITESYANLVIKDRKDIDIDSNDIMKLLNKEPGKYLTDIYEDIEKELLYRRLKNNKDFISKYILDNYG